MTETFTRWDAAEHLRIDRLLVVAAASARTPAGWPPAPEQPPAIARGAGRAVSSHRARRRSLASSWDREVGGCLRAGDTIRVSGRLTLGDRPDYDTVCIGFRRYPIADEQDRVFECAPLDDGNRFALEATLHRPGGYLMDSFARWPDSGWQNALSYYTGGIEVLPNRAPQAVGALDDRTLAVGYPGLALDVSRAFSDPDGDLLTFAASSSSPGVAGAAVSRDTVTVTPVRPGSATITVTATDDGGLIAVQRFAVTVAGPRLGGRR